MGILNKNSKGFNLVEIMMSLIIMSTLMAVSTPYYSSWLANMRIKSIARGINFGIIQARAEAIKKNQFISFIINNDTSWQILDQDNNVINQKNSTEGSKGISLENIPNYANLITFNGFGSVSQNPDGSATLTQITVNSPNFNRTQPLVVKISSGGGTLICSSTSECLERNAN